jgi:hypothetical protein
MSIRTAQNSYYYHWVYILPPYSLTHAKKSNKTTTTRHLSFPSVYLSFSLPQPIRLMTEFARFSTDFSEKKNTTNYLWLWVRVLWWYHSARMRHPCRRGRHLMRCHRSLARSLARPPLRPSSHPPSSPHPPWCPLPDDDLGMDVYIPHTSIHRSIHPSIHYHTFSSLTAS